MKSQTPRPSPLNIVFPMRRTLSSESHHNPDTNTNPYAPPTPSPLSPFSASSSPPSASTPFATTRAPLYPTSHYYRPTRSSITSPTRSNFSSPSVSPTRSSRASRIQCLLATDPLLSRLTPATITRLSADPSLNFSPGEKEWSLRAAEGIVRVGEWLREVEGWNLQWPRGRNGEGYLPGSSKRPKKRRKVEKAGMVSIAEADESAREVLKSPEKPLRRKLFAHKGTGAAENEGEEDGEENEDEAPQSPANGILPGDMTMLRPPADSPSLRQPRKPLTPYLLEMHRLRAMEAGKKQEELPQSPNQTPIKNNPMPDMSDESEKESSEEEGDTEEEETGGEEEDSGEESEEYWGSLKRKNVEQYEGRIEVIKSEIEDLDVEGLKGKVLSYRTGYTTNPVTDSSAIITATTLQLLPPLSRLTKLLSIWAVRIAVLKIVPLFLRWLQIANEALEEAYFAINQPSFTPNPNHPDINFGLGEWKGLEEETYTLIQETITQKVATAGKLMDTMLDALEGREDVLPDLWITELEGVEDNVGRWQMDGERVVLEGRLRLEELRWRQNRKEEQEREKAKTALVQEQERSASEARKEESEAMEVMEKAEETDRQLREAMEMHESVAEGIELPEDDDDCWAEDGSEDGFGLGMEGLMEKLSKVEDEIQSESDSGTDDGHGDISYVERGRRSKRYGSVDIDSATARAVLEASYIASETEEKSQASTVVRAQLEINLMAQSPETPPTSVPPTNELQTTESRELSSNPPSSYLNNNDKRTDIEAEAERLSTEQAKEIQRQQAALLAKNKIEDEQKRLAAEEASRLAKEKEAAAAAEEERLRFEEIQQRKRAEEENTRLEAEAKKQAAKDDAEIKAEAQRRRKLAEEEVERRRIASFEAEKRAIAERERLAAIAALEEEKKRKAAETEAEADRLKLAALEAEKLAMERREILAVLAAEQEARKKAADAEAERQRILAVEANKKAVAERERLAALVALEAEEKRKASEAEAERQRAIAVEAEKAAIAERERLAALEKKKAADAEAERQKKIAAEAERLAIAERERLATLAALEVERQRAIAAEEEATKKAIAERERLIALEVEEKRRTAEAEAEAEAERQRTIAAEAEKAAIAERERLATLAALEKKAAEAEAERQRAIAAEAEKQAIAERERLAALAALEKKAAEAEAERQRVIAAEAEKLAIAERERLAALEKKRVAEAEAEAERQQIIAAEEANKKAVAERERLAALENERKREAEAERQRAIAAEEAERERLAVLEDEKKRKAADAEVERQRVLAAEAERNAVAERERLAAIAAEVKRKAIEAELQRIAALEKADAEEKDRQQRVAEEAEIRRLAELESLRQREAKEAEERQKIAAIAAEAERQRLEREAESQKIARAEAERKRLAQAEAARIALEALEIKRAKEAAEAERKRSAEAEAEQTRLEKESQLKRQAEEAEFQRAAAAAELQRQKATEDKAERERRSIVTSRTEAGVHAKAESESHRITVVEIGQRTPEERLSEETRQRANESQDQWVSTSTEAEADRQFQELDRRRREAEEERMRLLDFTLAEQERKRLATQDADRIRMEKEQEENRVKLEQLREEREKEERLRSRIGHGAEQSGLTKSEDEDQGELEQGGGVEESNPESPSEELSETESKEDDWVNLHHPETHPSTLEFSDVAAPVALESPTRGVNNSQAGDGSVAFPKLPPIHTPVGAAATGQPTIPSTPPPILASVNPSAIYPEAFSLIPSATTQKTLQPDSAGPDLDVRDQPLEKHGFVEGVKEDSDEGKVANVYSSDDDDDDGDVTFEEVTVRLLHPPNTAHPAINNEERVVLGVSQIKKEATVPSAPGIINTISSAVGLQQALQLGQHEPSVFPETTNLEMNQPMENRIYIQEASDVEDYAYEEGSSEENLVSTATNYPLISQMSPVTDDAFDDADNADESFSYDTSFSDMAIIDGNSPPQISISEDYCELGDLSEFDIQPIASSTPKPKRHVSMSPQLDSITELATPRSARSVKDEHFANVNLSNLENPFKDISAAKSKKGLDAEKKKSGEVMLPRYLSTPVQNSKGLRNVPSRERVASLRRAAQAPQKNPPKEYMKKPPIPTIKSERSVGVPKNENKLRSASSLSNHTSAKPARNSLQAPQPSHRARSVSGTADSRSTSVKSNYLSATSASTAAAVRPRGVPRAFQRARSSTMSSDGGSGRDDSMEEERPRTREVTPDFALPPPPQLIVAKRNARQPSIRTTSASPDKNRRRYQENPYSQGSTSNLPDVPPLQSPGLNSVEQLDQKINAILATLPSQVRLTASNLRKLTESTSRSHQSLRSFEGSVSSIPGPRSGNSSPTPSQVPSYARPSMRRHHPNAPGDIKLYHLHRTDGQSPIKLYVRLVGENGERVMVRVGGGWADLSEYLKEYATHHASKKRAVSESKIEIQDLPSHVLQSSISNANLRRSPTPNYFYRSPSPALSSRPGSSHNGGLQTPALSHRNSAQTLNHKNSTPAFSYKRAESPMSSGRAASPAFGGPVNPTMRGGHNGTLSPRVGPATPNSNTLTLKNQLTPPGINSSPPSRPGSSSSAYRRSTSRLSFSESAFDSGEALASILGNSPESLQPLGLAGPKAKTLNISPENQAWVEEMMGQVRKASTGRRERVYSFTGSNYGGDSNYGGGSNYASSAVGGGSVCGDGDSEAGGIVSETDFSGREFGGKLSDMGKTGGTRRLYVKK